MKMSHHEISVVQLDIEHRLRQNGPLNPPETNRKRIRSHTASASGTGCALIHRAQPVKCLDRRGHPIHIVKIENANAEYGLMPLMNMWWPHTMNPKNPIESMA